MFPPTHFSVDAAFVVCFYQVVGPTLWRVPSRAQLKARTNHSGVHLLAVSHAIAEEEEDLLGLLVTMNKATQVVPTLTLACGLVVSEPQGTGPTAAGSHRYDSHHYEQQKPRGPWLVRQHSLGFLAFAPCDCPAELGSRFLPFIL